MTELNRVQQLIREEGDMAVNLLLEKNRAYGNSAISPNRFFSHADKTEQIKVRIDDKLNRLVNGINDQEEEDVVLDLIGYLILLRVAQRVQEIEAQESNLEYDRKKTLDLDTTRIGPVFQAFNENSYR